MKSLNQFLKKLLFISSLLLFSSAQVFSQSDVEVADLFLSQESSQQSLNKQSQNLNSGKENMSSNSVTSISLDNSQKKSSSELMSPSELLDKQMSLLDELDLQFKTLELQLQQAKNSLSNSEALILNLQKQLETCKIKILDLQKNLDEYNQALLSNKDDTSYIIGLLGEAAEKAEKLEVKIHELEVQQSRSFWFSTIGISLMSLIPICIGAIEYNKGDQYGKDYMWAGASIFIGGQILYQGGHWIFKFW